MILLVEQSTIKLLFLYVTKAKKKLWGPSESQNKGITPN